MPEAARMDAPAAPPSGTVIAFDFGERRIGVAIGETRIGQAHPLRIIDAAANNERFAAIAALIDEWRPALLVVGLPAPLVDDDDDDGAADAGTPLPHSMPARCRRFANQLRGRFGLPIEFADERLSSIEAGHRLRETGHDARSAKAHLDAVAAQLILQTYFDSHPHAPEPTP